MENKTLVPGTLSPSFRIENDGRGSSRAPHRRRAERTEALPLGGGERIWALAAIVVLCSCFLGCGAVSTSDVAPTDLATTVTAHVAFAGGGWRAHTGHAGWTLSLLDGGNRSLKEVFANVETIGSNSGGSWFSTMLTYSDTFVKAIEDRNAINTWDSTGWLGQQQALFDAATVCEPLSGDAFTACVFEEYAPKGATHWDSVVEGLVYRDYPLGFDVTLSSTRQQWATDKSLLLAATLLTNQVVLNENDFLDKQFYQVCLEPSSPVLNGDDGSSCTQGPMRDVTPVTFSSIPSSAGRATPLFLPAPVSATDPPVLNVGYTENAIIDPATASAVVENPLANENVPVVLAAAASSAATGFAASAVVSDDFEAAFTAADEALSFELANAEVVFADASDFSVPSLADKKFVRLADGGPVDNSGVAQIVSFLQLNKEADGFDIVAFDNVQELFSPGSGAANVGIDIANLFGKGLFDGDQYCSGPNGTGVCITVPPLQIFEEAPIVGPPLVTWSTSTGPKTEVHQLIYTQYAVTTIDNVALGVRKGSKGTLHAFTCVWSDAATAPQNNTTDGDFDAYTAMLAFINSGLQEQNGTGLKHLEAALGLTP